jgi:FtsH-binding integral membrane protein
VKPRGKHLERDAFYTFTLFIGASLGPWVASYTEDLDAGTFFGLLATFMALAAAISWHQPPAVLWKSYD